jgi:hypothetical protein
MFRTALRWQTNGQTHTILPIHPFPSALNYHCNIKISFDNTDTSDRLIWANEFWPQSMSWVATLANHVRHTAAVREWMTTIPTCKINTHHTDRDADRPTYIHFQPLFVFYLTFHQFAKSRISSTAYYSWQSDDWHSLFIVKESWVPVSAHWPATMPKVFVPESLQTNSAVVLKVRTGTFPFAYFPFH